MATGGLKTKVFSMALNNGKTVGKVNGPVTGPESYDTRTHVISQKNDTLTNYRAIMTRT